MSDATSLPSSPSRAAQSKPRHSLHLGRNFRSILLQPAQGFEGAFKVARRRQRSGDLPAEGWAPLVFSGVAGIAVMLLWLKVGGLADVREMQRADFRWTYLLSAVALGAVIGLGTQRLWGRVGPRLIAALRGDSEDWQQRMVWGAAAFPQIFAVFILLPLDLLIVGPASFTTDRISERVATVWAALSISVALGLVAWSLYVFARGQAVATEMGRSRVILTMLVAIITLGVAFAAPIIVPVLL